MSPSRKIIECILLLLIFLAIGDRTFSFIHTIQTTSPHTNVLCTGACYTHKNQPQELFFEWELPTDFDHSRKRDIYDLRTRRVNEKLALFKDGYVPTKSIFGLIIDGLPWWGFDGYYRTATRPAYGRDNSSGKSLRGVEILNPFYLVTAKITNFSIWNSSFNWLKGGSAEGGLCSYFPYTEGVSWFPEKKYAETTYYVSDWIKTLRHQGCIEDIKDQHLSIVIDPVNAQDLSLNYLSFSKPLSVNITEEAFFQRPKRLNFFYHRGTSCGLATGCNNISPLVGEFQNIKTASFDAKLAVNLWENEPVNPSAEPDFIFYIKFE